MTYKINGTAITLQPTSGNWVNREIAGYTGNQNPIYPGLRSYELSWDIIEESDLYQLQGFFNGITASGSVVAELPKYADATYNFFAYTGCMLNEPQIGPFFEQHPMQAKLLISRIRT